MTPIHATDLIERCRTTPAGHLEAWSIQGRYGVAILTFGVGLGLLWAHLMRSGSQAGGLWVLCGFSVFALCFGIAICRLRETLRVDETGIHLGSPVGPAPERIHEDLRSGAPALMIQGTTSPRVTWRFRGVGWAFFALASLAGWAISRVMEPALLGWAIPFPFWGTSLYFLADAWVGDHSREHVSVRQGIVAREVELLGRRWRRAEISSSELQHLRVQSESPSARGVALVSNDRVLVVGTGLEGDEIDWLHGWLAERVR